MSAAYSSLSIEIERSEYPPAAATHDQSLLRSDIIVLILINSCSKSFHIVKKISQLRNVGVYF